jgi:hypothetical protein
MQVTRSLLLLVPSGHMVLFQLTPVRLDPVIVARSKVALPSKACQVGRGRADSLT